MQKASEEVNLNDYLTSYLKLFKTSFHAQICLIESLSLDSSNLQQKMQKAKENILVLDNQNIISEDLPVKINWKTLERFCMRINQFIQYRISKAKMLLQQSVINQLQSMCYSMQKLFSQLGKDKANDEQQSIPEFFMRISDIENRFMIKILKKVTQVNSANRFQERTPSFIRQFLQSKIKKKFLRQNPKQDEQISNEPTTFHKMIQNSQKINQLHYAARLRPRKSAVQKLQPVPSGFIHQDGFSGMLEYKSVTAAQSQIILKNSQQNIQINEEYIEEGQAKGQKNEKVFKSMDNIMSFNLIKDIIELQYDKNDRYNDQTLLKQLMENNKKNSFIIEKYRKRATKVKLKMDRVFDNQENKLDFQIKHKRSNTLNTTRKNADRREQKVLGLPPLKRKIALKA